MLPPIQTNSTKSYTNIHLLAITYTNFYFFKNKNKNKNNITLDEIYSLTRTSLNNDNKHKSHLKSLHVLNSQFTMHSRI